MKLTSRGAEGRIGEEQEMAEGFYEEGEARTSYPGNRLSDYTATEADALRGMPSELMRLDSLINRLESTATTLREKLAPLLVAPEQQKKGAETMPPKPARSPMAANVGEFCDRLWRAGYSIENTLNALDL
jgi:hypothetical protein